MSKNIVPCGGFELGDSLKINKNNELDLAYGGILFCISNDNYVRFCDIKYYDEIKATIKKGEYKNDKERYQAFYEMMEPYAIPIEEIFKMCLNLYPVYFLEASEEEIYKFCGAIDSDYFVLQTFHIYAYASNSFTIRFEEIEIERDGKIYEIAEGTLDPSSAKITRP